MHILHGLYPGKIWVVNPLLSEMHMQEIDPAMSWSSLKDLVEPC